MNKSGDLDIVSFQKSLISLRPKDRLDAILRRPDAMLVIRQLPVQDLFITIKEVGLSDSLELLELLAPEQVKAFLDLDGWSQEHINPKAIGSWFESLFSANAKRAGQVFRELDIELVSLLLKRYAHIYDVAAEEEPGDLSGEHSITPDGRYIVVFHPDEEEQTLIRFLKQALEQLYARDMSFALRVIEGVRWETESGLEEEALRWRDGRMQDMGFAPIEEARDILAYVDPVQAATREPRHVNKGVSEDMSPNSTLVLRDLKKHSVLSKAIENLSDPVRTQVYNELIATINRVYFVQSKDLGDMDVLAELASHTLNTIQMALSFLSQGQESKLEGIVTQHSMRHLFQIGHSLSLRLHRQWQKVMADPNSGLLNQGYLRLDSPLKEVAIGILRQEPLYYAGLGDPKRVDYRRFQSLTDIAQTAQAIAEATFRTYLLGPRGVGVYQPPGIETGKGTEMATHSVLLATWLSHQLLDHAQSIKPLTQNQLQQLLSRMEIVGEGRRFLRSDIEKSTARVRELALTLVPSPSMKTAEEAAQRASQYTQVVLGAVEAELSRINDEKIDPRFISTVLVETLAN